MVLWELIALQVHLKFLVIADHNSNPEFIATDMFAQAEHDELAQAILMTTSERLIKSVISKMHDLIDDNLEENY